MQKIISCLKVVVCAFAVVFFVLSVNIARAADGDPIPHEIALIVINDFDQRFPWEQGMEGPEGGNIPTEQDGYYAVEIWRSSGYGNPYQQLYYEHADYMISVTGQITEIDYAKYDSNNNLLMTYEYINSTTENGDPFEEVTSQTWDYAAGITTVYDSSVTVSGGIKYIDESTKIYDVSTGLLLEGSGYSEQRYGDGQSSTQSWCEQYGYDPDTNELESVSGAVMNYENDRVIFSADYSYGLDDQGNASFQATVTNWFYDTSKKVVTSYEGYDYADGRYLLVVGTTSYLLGSGALLSETWGCEFDLDTESGSGIYSVRYDTLTGNKVEEFTDYSIYDKTTHTSQVYSGSIMYDPETGNVLQGETYESITDEISGLFSVSTTNYHARYDRVSGDILEEYCYQTTQTASKRTTYLMNHRWYYIRPGVLKDEIINVAENDGGVTRQTDTYISYTNGILSSKKVYICERDINGNLTRQWSRSDIYENGRIYSRRDHDYRKNGDGASDFTSEYSQYSWDKSTGIQTSGSISGSVYKGDLNNAVATYLIKEEFDSTGKKTKMYGTMNINYSGYNGTLYIFCDLSDNGDPTYTHVYYQDGDEIGDIGGEGYIAPDVIFNNFASIVLGGPEKFLQEMMPEAQDPQSVEPSHVNSSILQELQNKAAAISEQLTDVDGANDMKVSGMMVDLKN